MNRHFAMTVLLTTAALATGSMAALQGQTTTGTPGTAVNSAEGLVMRGQTEPVAKVEVPAEVRGQLASVDVKEGQVVKKGERLAKIEDAIQQQAVALARMEASSTSEIRYAQNQLEFAKVENERWQKNTSATDLEKRQKELAVKQAELVVELDQEKQKQAQIKLRKEEITLERMTIKSPIDGAVLRVNKQAGEETDENPLVIVVQVNKLNAVFYPPKQLFGKLSVGDKVTLLLATEPVIQREAIVVAVDPIIDQASQLFRVKMELDNADAQIPAGTGATWTWKGK